MTTPDGQPDEARRAEAAKLCEQGYALLNAMKSADAEHLLATACRLDPGNALAQYRHALALGDIGRFDAALAAYDRALTLAPEDAKAHNNRGSALQQLGRLQEAEAAFRMAQRLQPDVAPPYVNLGHLLETQGRNVEARDVFQSAIDRGLDKALFGQYIASLLGSSTPERSPDSWVRSTFDNFAPNFDQHLLSLGYRVPERIAEVLADTRRRVGDVIDLGCGTGLCGAALQKLAPQSITGIDLSRSMIALARARAVYTWLHEREVGEWLANAPSRSVDTVVAADVFIYIGKLDAIFADIARILRPRGFFAFSVERVDGADYVLQPTGRYAQSKDYVNRLAAGAFDLLACSPEVVRSESGKPVHGLVYLLQRKL